MFSYGTTLIKKFYSLYDVHLHTNLLFNSWDHQHKQAMLSQFYRTKITFGKVLFRLCPITDSLVPPPPPPGPLPKMAIFSLFLWIVRINRSKKNKQKMQSDFFRNFEFLGVFWSFKFLKIFFMHFTAFIMIQKR